MPGNDPTYTVQIHEGWGGFWAADHQRAPPASPSTIDSSPPTFNRCARAEAEVAGRAVGRVGAARRRPGSGGSTTRGRGTSRRASRGASRPADRSDRGAGCAVVAGIEPVGAPLPHVAGHVVQAEAVGRESVDRCGAGEPVGARCCRSGTCPGTRSCDACPPGSRSSPHGKRRRRARRARRTPTPLRSAAACRPTRSTPAHRARRRGRRGGRRDRRGPTAVPPGWRQSAPIDLPPPRRRGDGAGVGGSRREEPGEDERPAEALGLGDVPGRGDERGEALVGHRDRRRCRTAQLDLVHRSLPVGGIARRPDGAHPELATWQLDRSRGTHLSKAMAELAVASVRTGQVSLRGREETAMVEVMVPEELLGSFNGVFVLPGDSGYDTTRAVHNGLVDKRPGLIARCHNVADVRDAVKFGRSAGSGDLGPRRRPQRCRPGGHRRRADDRPVADARGRRRPRPTTGAGPGRRPPGTSTTGRPTCTGRRPPAA